MLVQIVKDVGQAQRRPHQSRNNMQVPTDLVLTWAEMEGGFTTLTPAWGPLESQQGCVPSVSRRDLTTHPVLYRL